MIACLDPNPLVAGKGVKILGDAGVEVVNGLLESQVQIQLAGFLTRMQTGKPKTTLKLGCSLDGNIALKNGESKWITSSDSRKDVQIHRALSGAILTSSNTVIADNPSMTVRQEEWPLAENFATQPLKAVLDKSLSTSPNSKIYQDNSIVFYNQDSAPKNKQQAFIDKGVELIPISLKDDTLGNNLDINEVLIELGKREINDVWIECGAKLAGHLLANKHINTLILYQAPILLGANSINSMGFIINSMQDAVKLHRTEIRQIGCDTKMTYLL
ncbi:MAG: bifunctional diaminohydroxyphosphoribosylaminopyrimidine deaminase/5-amino-6-(5-phosphoribosylamino)uracil reductase RibD [Pseudomonadales bacterium]|nr:bifunctional diaminohydroxyphosphoribosylaminopyrimidine deaminase/5-amino-6-(5-phosphoribosylamino)uracil reductase RibD [Pseudomonadales bacterium]